MTPEVRRQFERDAKRNNRSLSREIEERLKESISAPRPADRHARALTYIVSQIIALFRATRRQSKARPFNWYQDRFDREALKAAIVYLIDQLPKPQTQGKSSFIKYNETAAEAGKSVASIILALMQTDSVPDRPSGNVLLALRQVADDLGGVRPSLNKGQRRVGSTAR